jgi:hypothetical protein
LNARGPRGPAGGRASAAVAGQTAARRLANARSRATLYLVTRMLILVANSISDQTAGCRAAKREQRVLAVGLEVCQSAILTRLTAAAMMMCCKWVLANPI